MAGNEVEELFTKILPTETHLLFSLSSASRGKIEIGWLDDSGFVSAPNGALYTMVCQ